MGEAGGEGGRRGGGGGASQAAIAALVMAVICTPHPRPIRHSGSIRIKNMCFFNICTRGPT